MDTFTRAYIAAIFTCETEPGTTRENMNADRDAWRHRSEEGQQCEIPGDYDADDLGTGELDKIVADCARFQAINAELLALAYDHPVGYDEEQAGIDFWLTRNGHGAGFWDRGLGEIGDKLSDACGWRSRNLPEPFREISAYLGDDDKVYLM